MTRFKGSIPTLSRCSPSGVCLQHPRVRFKCTRLRKSAHGTIRFRMLRRNIKVLKKSGRCCLVRSNANAEESSTKPPPKPKSANLPPSPKAIFGLWMCALQCLAHTSASSPKQHILRPGHQIYEYPRQILSASSSMVEERIPGLVLHAFDELVQIVEARSDKETFMAVDESGKNVISFCDHWSCVAKRV